MENPTGHRSENLLNRLETIDPMSVLIVGRDADRVLEPYLEGHPGCAWERVSVSPVAPDRLLDAVLSGDKS